jgi:hypothetical protein
MGFSNVKVSADVVFKIVDYVNEHGPTGVNRVKELIETWNKSTVTAVDWEMLEDLWDKTPDDFLAEAKARLDK